MSEHKDRKNEVFAVPLGDGSYGYGQVLAAQWPVFYITGYDARTAGVDSGIVDRLASFTMVFFGNLFDVLIANGTWPSIGSVDPPPGVIFPCYKVVVSGQTYLQSWDKSRCRLADEDEIAIVENRTNRSPASLTVALQAHFGLAAWDDRFNGMKREFVERSAALL